MGEQAIWDEVASRKGARVTVRSGYDEMTDRDSWLEMIDWLIEKQVRLLWRLMRRGVPSDSGRPWPRLDCCRLRRDAWVLAVVEVGLANPAALLRGG